MVDPPHLGQGSHTTPGVIWEKGDIGKRGGRLVGEFPENKGSECFVVFF